jgi:hypothetical protein
MKSKQWTREDEKHLRVLTEEKLSLPVIAQRLCKPLEAVRAKIKRLGLEVDDQNRSIRSSTTRKLWFQWQGGRYRVRYQ